MANICPDWLPTPALWVHQAVLGCKVLILKAHVDFFLRDLVALLSVFAALRLWKLFFDIRLDLIPLSLWIRGGHCLMLDERKELLSFYFRFQLQLLNALKTVYSFQPWCFLCRSCNEQTKWRQAGYSLCGRSWICLYLANVWHVVKINQ